MSNTKHTDWSHTSHVTGSDVEPAPTTVETVPHRSPWPMVIALALAAAVAPTAAWLLVFAPLSGIQRLGIAAAVPLTVALLAAAGATLVDHLETKQ